MTRLSEEECNTLTRGHCPRCQARGFVLGPRGGVAINIECANLACRERFNVTSVSGEIFLAELITRESEGGAQWPSAPHKGTFS